VAAQCKAWVCGRLLAGIVGSSPAGDLDVCLLGVLFVVRCVGLITRPEESYRVWCVAECDREASISRRPWTTRGCCAMRKKITCFRIVKRLLNRCISGKTINPYPTNVENRVSS